MGTGVAVGAALVGVSTGADHVGAVPQAKAAKMSRVDAMGAFMLYYEPCVTRLVTRFSQRTSHGANG
jgi:hypothetical protein